MIDIRTCPVKVLDQLDILSFYGFNKLMSLVLDNGEWVKDSARRGKKDPYYIRVKGSYDLMIDTVTHQIDMVMYHPDGVTPPATVTLLQRNK